MAKHMDLSQLDEAFFKNDLDFIRKLNFKDRPIEDAVWNKFCQGSEDKEENSCSRNFTLHPKRIYSGSDSSEDSERVVNFGSTPAFKTTGLKEGSEPPKKLHEKLTKVSRAKGDVEINIGDGLRVDEQAGRKNEGKDIWKDMTLLKDNKSKKVVKKLSKDMQKDKKPLPLADMPNAVFQKKFAAFVDKSLMGLTNIVHLLEKGAPEPDGEEDLNRRETRVREFSSRFVRNYLYPLNQQIKDLSVIECTNNPHINNKLISAYQIIYQGLQAYQNHLPTSIGNYASDKLNLLLENLFKVCEIHEKLPGKSFENSEDITIEALKMKAKQTQSRIIDMFNTMSSESMLKSNLTKISLLTKTKVKKPKTNKLQARLSMYSVSASFRNDSFFKKAVETWNKKKYNVKSKYKTAAYKHRPPTEKPKVAPLPSKLRLFPKKSSGMLKNTPMNTPVREENIKTMVEMDRDKPTTPKDSNENVVERDVSHEEIASKLLQLVLVQSRRNEEGDDVEEEDAVKEFNNEGRRFLDKLVKELERNDKKGKKKTVTVEEPEDSRTAERSQQEKKKSPRVVSISGEGNAKLICIRDDSPITDCNEKPEANEQEEKNVSDNNEATVKNKPGKWSSVKISRLPKNLKQLQLLPKNFAINIVQYKLDFSRYCKTNPLYVKCTDLQPWVLMAKLSEEVLNYALQVVTKEIEINRTVEKVYKAELQL